MPTGPTPQLTERLLHALLRAWGLIRQAQEPYFARFGISPSQWGILRVLQRAAANGESELPLKAVSERLLIQPPSVTGVVDRLERRGLVTRSPGAEDMRVRHLGLTSQGRDLLARVLRGHAGQIRSLFAGLRPEEQQALLDLLHQLEAHLREFVSPTNSGACAGSRRGGEAHGLARSQAAGRSKRHDKEGSAYGSATRHGG